MSGLDVLVPTRGRPGALAVTLATLACSTVPGLRVVVSDASPGTPSYDDPVVRGVVRVLEHRGAQVELHRHLPTAPPAEQREALLGLATAERTLLLDGDRLLEPDSVRVLLDAARVGGSR